MRDPALHRPRWLVVELRRMGDALLGVPFVRGACEQADVFVLGTSSATEILSAVLPSSRLIRWDPPWVREHSARPTPSRSCLRWPEVLRQLRALRFTAAVSVWPDVRVHWVMAMSGAPTRVGFPMTRRNVLAWERPWRKRQLQGGQMLAGALTLLAGGRLLTHPLDRTREDQPHWAAWRQLAEALRVPWRAELPWVRPAPSTEVPPSVPALRAAADRHGRPLWALHPGARVPSKQWGGERWQTLVRTGFAARHMPLVIVQAPDGPRLTPCGDLQTVVAPRHWQELMAIWTLVDAVVCHDSLPSHLAAALGKPVVTVFGSGRPAWFAPYGSEAYVVHAPVCPHQPCLDRCVMPSPQCLEAVTPEQVLATVLRVEAALPFSRSQEAPG